MTKKDRTRNISIDILDVVETATSKWTRQKKSEERHPGNIRYRTSRMTREPRTTQKEAAWEVMEQAYLAASGNGALPASARQIYYQARPKIMAMTDDKELAYGYFSQTLLPDYIVEKDGGLIQLFSQDTIALDAYFVYPEELRSVSRVQVFRDFLVSKAQRWRF